MTKEQIGLIIKVAALYILAIAGIMQLPSQYHELLLATVNLVIAIAAILGYSSSNYVEKRLNVVDEGMTQLRVDSYHLRETMATKLIQPIEDKKE